jgi:hypothetical protein
MTSLVANRGPGHHEEWPAQEAGIGLPDFFGCLTTPCAVKQEENFLLGRETGYRALGVRSEQSERLLSVMVRLASKHLEPGSATAQ